MGRRQEASKRLGLKSLLRKEWAVEKDGSLSGEELVAVLCSISRKEKFALSSKENEEMAEQRLDYLDYLESEVEVIEEKVKAKAVETQENKTQEADEEDDGEG